MRIFKSENAANFGMAITKCMPFFFSFFHLFVLSPSALFSFCLFVDFVAVVFVEFFSQLCNATGDTDGLMLLYDSTYCSAPKFQTFSQEP